MKKIISIILIMIFTLTTVTIYADEGNAEQPKTFSDVKTTHWFYQYVTSLVEYGRIDGYPDGTFKPNNNITFEEFLKLACNSLRNAAILSSENDVNWYDQYITTAIEYHVMDETYTKYIGTEIDRKTMAILIYNVLAENGDLPKVTDAELKAIDEMFPDITIQDKEVIYNIKAGIITGYTDNTFKPNDKLKRSEVATVIMRLIDEDIRKPIEIKYTKTLADFPDPDLEYLRSYPCHVWNEAYTVADLNQRTVNYNHKSIVSAANALISSAFNIDYTTINYEKTKEKLVYSMRDTVEYRGVKYDYLLDENEQKTTTLDNTYNDFLNKYIADIKNNKVKIQGQFYTDTSLCIIVHNHTASRGIIRFKIESAKDLNIVKEILFIRDTDSEKSDNRRDEIMYGGYDNSRYISNDSIKLKTDVWYELAVDIVLPATFKNDGIYLYQNYDTSSFMFEYMYPIYIKELK